MLQDANKSRKQALHGMRWSVPSRVVRPKWTPRAGQLHVEHSRRQRRFPVAFHVEFRDRLASGIRQDKVNPRQT